MNMIQQFYSWVSTQIKADMYTKTCTQLFMA